MLNIAAVAPYSGAMLEMVARSPSVSAAAPSPWNSRYAPTTLDLRRNSVSASTRSVAVMPGCGLPASSTPTISGSRIHDARPSITFSASRPPTPTATTPSASTCGVWLSVPTSVSGKATPSFAWTTGDIRSRLIWCMIPLPGGITSMLLERALRPLDEVEAILVAPILDRAVLRERLRDRRRRTRRPANGRRSAAPAPPG